MFTMTYCEKLHLWNGAISSIAFLAKMICRQQSLTKNQLNSFFGDICRTWTATFVTLDCKLSLWKASNSKGTGMAAPWTSKFSTLGGKFGASKCNKKQTTKNSYEYLTFFVDIIMDSNPILQGDWSRLGPGRFQMLLPSLLCFLFLTVKILSTTLKSDCLSFVQISDILQPPRTALKDIFQPKFQRRVTHYASINQRFEREITVPS